MSRRRPTIAEVRTEIALLADMDIIALQQRWHELFEIEPPFKIRSGFLRSAIAYRLQELAFGGLAPKFTRQMARRTTELREMRKSHAQADGPASSQRSERPVLSPGTRLLREWNGVTEAVDVIKGGFEWRGKTYASLSTVAGAITGTKWSGPAFFGLKSKRQSSPEQKASHRGLSQSSVGDAIEGLQMP